MWGSPRRGWTIGPGPKPTRYLRSPRFGRWGYCGIHNHYGDYPLGDGRYYHYRSGNFVLHRDYI